MAELMATAFATMAAGGASAGAAGTVGLTAAQTAAAVASAGAAAAPWAAGTTITTAAGGLSGALGALQTAATVGSMAATLFGGISGLRDSQNQARFAGLNAEADRLAAEERSLRIRRELVEKIGANRVAFAGSGLDISSGASIEGALSADAGYEAGLARDQGESARAAGLATAASLRNQGTSRLLSAAVRAGGDLAGLKIDIARRG